MIIFLPDIHKSILVDSIVDLATVRRQTGSKKTKPIMASSETVEEKMWAMAYALRGTMDAAEYKHVVLGLIFLKHVSDAFEEYHSKLDLIGDADPEDPDEYHTQNIFWVPPEGRWARIMAQTRQPKIGQIVDGAMAAIERENPAIKNVFPKNYVRPALGKTRLGRIIDLISDIRVGDGESIPKDVWGRMYEYFLSRFANAEGRRGGEFYTPRSIVQLLVAMLRPCRGRVYDPCCGSSGMFVHTIEFMRAHANGNENNNGAKKTQSDVSIYGQELNHATWQLARMNLAMRDIDGSKIAHGDSFHNDQHPDLKFDFILANPPFGISDWGGDHLQEDKRWICGTPPKGNANFAWIQHMLHHLTPSGMAGFVLANDSMSSNQSGEGDIRKSLVEANVVDCMVALPGQLFYSTQMPACLWFLSKSRVRNSQKNNVLFIDARQMGMMADRMHREFTNDDICKISDTYRAWCGDKQAGKYSDVPGFCKDSTLDEIRKHGHVLTPGRYVGAESQPDNDESFEEKIKHLALQWRELHAKSEKLDGAIIENMKNIGFDMQAVKSI